MKTFIIKPISRELVGSLQHKIDFKTKPLGSLGRLEELALKIGLIQESVAPQLINPHMLIFAGDHGVAEEGVSAFPQEVTYQMVFNFLHGGAAITVLCNQNGIAFKVVDSGVKYEFEPHPNLIQMKVASGTQNFANGPAMTLDELNTSLINGATVVDEIYAQGCNIIGFGEMGIANTTAASALMHAFTGIPIASCVGKGTGINSEGVKIKEAVLQRAMNSNSQAKTVYQKLAAFGGFEIAQMVGAMLRAAELKMVIMVDGFIATSAFLAATKIDGNIYDYAIYTHQSEENGHKMMLAFLNAQPLLSLNMRLGEGSGCAVAYPIIKSAVTFLNDMASFEAAGVTNAEDVVENV